MEIVFKLRLKIQNMIVQKHFSKPLSTKLNCVIDLTLGIIKIVKSRTI